MVRPHLEYSSWSFRHIRAENKLQTLLNQESSRSQCRPFDYPGIGQNLFHAECQHCPTSCDITHHNRKLFSARQLMQHCGFSWHCHVSCEEVYIMTWLIFVRIYDGRGSKQSIHRFGWNSSKRVHTHINLTCHRCSVHSCPTQLQQST
jgi:hypothetical protein